MYRQILLATVACFALIASGCDTSLPAGNPYDPDVPAHEREPGSLAGRIVPELDVDLEQAVVRVQTAGKAVIPGPDGTFEIPDLIPGVHELRIEAPRHSVWRQTGFYVDTGTRVDLGEVRLVAARGSLSGAVVLEKVPGVPLDTHGGVLVTARPAPEQGRLAAGETGKSVSSNPDGSWSLDGLTVGRYVVQGTHEEFFNWDTLTVLVTEDEATPVHDIVLRSISGVIDIDEGAEYTNSADVTLRVLAFEADEMKISEDPDLADGEWQTFQVDNPWTLAGEDGVSTLYARFRNNEGFITPIVRDSIVLDRVAPVGAEVSIADGAEYVQSRQVALTLAAADALSGVASMRVALDGDVFDEPWVDFAAQQVVELPLGPTEEPDGIEREVLAQFRDGAGNQSDVVTDTVSLDSMAPQNPSLLIDGGAALTASRTVGLTLSADGATRMMVSNDAGLAGEEWMPYAPSLGWILTEGEEQKTVFVRFADDAGNQTDIVEDGIELNTSGGVAGRFVLEGAGANGNAGITVELSTDPVRTETTDAPGAFAFTGVPVGAYSLRATLDGFDAVAVPYVAVEPGQNSDVGSRTMPRSRGSLRGVARRAGEDASAHGGILVEVEGEDLTAVTAATGQWTISGVPVGQYTVRASSEGYLDATASDVDLVADGETLVPDLVLSANPGSVAGAVVLERRGANEHGGAEILIAGQSVLTQDDGSFLVSDVPAGTYALTALAAGFAAAEKLVTVEPGERADAGTLELAVARGDLAGTAEREGEADRSGILVEVAGSALSAVTGAGGDWTIRGVPVGQYTVRASASGFTPAQAPDVNVLEGETTDVANLLLPADPGSVTGMVTLEGEATDAYGDVLLVLEGSGLSTLSEDNGVFTIAAVPAGTYPLTASKDDFSSAQTVVTVRAGQATDAGTLDLPIARGSIAGTATLVASDDHSGITVEVDGTGFAGVTGGSGDFRIDSVPVGTYSLTARKEGYLSTTAGPVVVEEDKTTTADLGELGRQQGDFTIEERVSGDKEFLNELEVTLVFSQLPPDPDQIWAAEDDGFSDGAWENFDDAGNTHPYDLLSGDGTVTVYVKFRDAALQESPVFSSSVVLDTIAPDPASSVEINGDAAFSDDMDVSLTLVGQDATSGVSKMCLSFTGACDPADDQPFQASFSPFRLVDPPPGADGEKTVSVWFVDRAGNRSAGPAEDTIYLDRVAPENATLEINGGAAWTRDALVTLSLSAEDVCSAGYPGGCGSGTADPAQMLISNDSGFPGAQWEPYATTRAWFLAPGDGPKTVYVKYRDGAGNEIAGFASDGISLDRTAPSDFSLSLTELPPDPIIGNGYTNNADVELSVPAVGADQMCIYGDVQGAASCVWQAHQDTITVTLDDSIDGPKAVSVRFRDAAGNEAGPLSTAVVYDGTPPASGSVAIEGGATHVSSSTVELTLGAVDATTDIQEMRLANGALPGGSWEPYATVRIWSLIPGDGTGKQVTVEFRDLAGNLLQASDTVALDSAAPTPVSLAAAGNSGEPAGYSHDATVNLTLTADDALDADSLSYCVANDVSFSGGTCGTFGAGAPPVTLNGWNLVAGSGVRQVFAKVWDRAGNETVGSAAIVVDGDAPGGVGVSIEENALDGQPGNGYTKYAAITLHVDAVSADQVCVSGPYSGAPANCDEASGGWGAYVSAMPLTLTGGSATKTLNVYLRDLAHNTSGPHPVSVVLDTAAPSTCEVAITGTSYDLSDNPQDDGALTALGDVELQITAVDTDGRSPIVSVQLSNEPGFPGASWQAFTSSPMGIDSWLLASGSADGVARSVYVRCLDAADNELEGPSDSILLDSVAPSSPSVLLDGGAEYTIDATVDLDLSAVGASHAKFGLDPTFVAEVWVASGSWPGSTVDLAASEGTQPVYAKYRDDAGNQSAVTLDSIFYDLTAPAAPTAPVSPGRLDGDGRHYAALLAPTVSWTASAATDVEHYVVTIDAAEYGTPSVSFVAPVLTEALHTWSVRAVDRAGRESTPANGTDFVVDVTAPTTPGFEDVAETAVGLVDPNRYPDVGTLDLAVTSTDANFSGYQIRGGHDGTGTPVTDWVDQGAATGYVFYLLDDQLNTLLVRAADKAGNASDADFVAITEDSTPPLPPVDPEFTQGQAQVQARWQPSPSEDVVGYNVYYGTTPGLPNGSFADQGASPVFVGDVLQAGLTGLPDGTPMYISLSAVDVIGQESPRTLETSVVPNTVTPEDVGAIGGTARSLTIGPDDLGLLSTGQGLELLDLSVPSTITKLSEVDLPGGAFESAFSAAGGGKWAIVAGGEFGLQIVDISDQSNPVRAAAAPVRKSAIQLIVDGDHAYVRDENVAISVFDVTDPLAVSEIGTYFYFYTSDAGEIALRDDGTNKALYAGTKVLDVTDPSTPSERASPILPEGPRVVDGADLFIFDFRNVELQQWDATDALNPSVSATKALNLPPLDLAINGGYVVVARGEAGVKFFDPSAGLAGYGAMDVPGSAVAITGSEAKPFVIDEGAGLLEVDFSDPESFVDLASSTLTGVYQVRDATDMPGGATIALLDDSSRVGLFDASTLSQTTGWQLMVAGGTARGVGASATCVATSSGIRFVTAPVSDLSVQVNAQVCGSCSGGGETIGVDVVDLTYEAANRPAVVGGGLPGRVYGYLLEDGPDPDGEPCEFLMGTSEFLANATGSMCNSTPSHVVASRHPDLPAAHAVMVISENWCEEIGLKHFEIDGGGELRPYGGDATVSEVHDPMMGDIVDLRLFTWPGTPDELWMAYAANWGYGFRKIEIPGVGEARWAPEQLSAAITGETLESVYPDPANNRVYVAGYGFLEVRTMDDPPTVLTRIATSESGLLFDAGAGSVTEVFRYANPNPQLWKFGGPVPGGASIVGPGLAFELYAEAVFDGGLLYLLDALRGLTVIDVSDPTQPQTLGSVDLGGEHLAFDVAGSWAAVVVDRNMVLVDVDDPLAPASADSSYVWNLYSATDVEIHRGWAHAARGSGYSFMGLRINEDDTLGKWYTTGEYSDPTAPSDSRAIEPWSGHMLDAQGDGTIGMYDITDPSSVTELATRSLGLSAGDGPPQSIDGGTRSYCLAVAAEGAACGKVDHGDDSLATEPVGRETTDAAADLRIVGSEAVVAEASRGLRVWDSEDAADPASDVRFEEMGYMDTPGTASALAVDGPYVYLVDKEGGLRIVELIDASAPRRRTSISDCLERLVVDGGSVFGIGCDKLIEVEVYGGTPTQWQSEDITDAWLLGIAVRNGYAFVGNDIDPLTAYELHDLGTPIDVCGDCENKAGPVALWGEYAVTVANRNTVELISIREPMGKLQQVDSEAFSESNSSAAVAVAAGRAAVVTDFPIFRLYDLTRSGLGSMGSISLPGSPKGVAMTRSLAYVASGWAGLRVVDISGGPPVEVGAAGTPGFAREVRVHGRYAFVAQGSGLTIFDLSTPTSPTPIATYEAGVEVLDVRVLGTAAYLATGASGGVIVDLR